MMISRRKLYSIALLLSIFLLNAFIFSCATTKKASKSDAQNILEQNKNNPQNGTGTANSEQKSAADKASPDKKPSGTSLPGAGTLLNLPAKDELVEKQLDAELLSNIEKASPVSLQTAIMYIENDSKGMTDLNKIYLKIISDILYLVYPWETDGMKPPQHVEDDKLLKALQLVKNSEYPQSLDSDSFLSLIIPALMLTDSKSIELLTSANKLDIKARLQKAKKLRSDSVLPYYLLGILSEDSNNSYDAGLYYKKAWTLEKSCYPAGLRYAELLADSGNGNKALEIIKNLEKFFPNKYEIKELYARAYIAKAEWDLASKYIVDILKAEPENLSVLLLRVRVLIEQKEYLKANALLDAYSTKSQTSRDYLLYRAMISKKWNNNLEAARDFLTKAYNLYPNSFKVLLSCADICFSSSQKINNKSASFFIQKVLEKDPNDISALSLLVKNHINNENWNQAISLAQKLNNKMPGKMNKKLLVQACLGGGRYNQALSLSESLYYSEKNPKVETIELYAASLLYTKNYTKLNSLINKHVSSVNSELKSILYYYKAKMNRKNGDLYLSNLRSSLLANPRNKDSLFAMYQWYFSGKDYRKAKYYLGQVLSLNPKNKKIVNLSKNLDRLLAD